VQGMGRIIKCVEGAKSVGWWEELNLYREFIMLNDFH